MNKEKDTAFVLNELSNVTSISQGLNMIDNNSSSIKSAVSFKDFFDTYFAEHNLKPADVIRKSMVSRKYAYDILNGTKKASRDRIIALCFAAKMDLNETNHALEYAGHNKLYAKSRRDAIIIVALNQMNSGNHDIQSVSDLIILLDEKDEIPFDI